MSTKNYSSIYNIKDYAINEVAPKYFNMDKVNDLNIGLLGYTTELIANLTEDNFNTVTMYMNEMFPNLAVLPESIYNYALLFQIDGTFATAAGMDMMLFVSEKDIIDNATRLSGTTNDSVFGFVLDSDMVIDIEGVQFMPDYDILIKYKAYNGDVIFTAEYDMRKYNYGYQNSISNIVNPYIRIKRINYNGVKYLLLIIKAHRVNKFVQTETILSNSVISSPSYTIEFDDSLASFDVFYTSPSGSFNGQLQKRLAGSSPLKEGFCFYKIKDENKLEITFSTRDNYFHPEFNSELTIVYYTTTGKAGNFPLYTGNSITVVPSSEVYQYNNNIVVFAIPQSASTGGTDVATLEELKRIVIEKFSTVESYTNENDLQMYFSNIKDQFNADILFIKKRDDLFERLFTSFSLLKDENNNIYHTNTVNAVLTPSSDDFGTGDFDISLDQSNMSILKPGHVFKYIDTVRDGVEIDKTIKSLSEENALELIQNSKEDFLYTNPYLIYVTQSPTAVGYYLNTVNNNYMVDYIYTNPSSLVQFICNSMSIKRNAISGDDYYEISVMLTPTSTLDTPLVKSITNSDGNTIETVTNALVVRVYVSDNDTKTCYIDLELTKWNIPDQLYTFTGKIYTDDVITGDSFNVTNMKDSDTNKVNDTQLIPMFDCELQIHTYYKYPNGVVLVKNSPVDDDIENYKDMYIDVENDDDRPDNLYIHTNTYSTETNPVTFINPVRMIRSTAINRESNNDTGYDIMINSIPLVRAETMLNTDQMWYFYSSLTQQYNYVNNVIDRVTNNYSIDMKLYNTYGKSKNFYIGDNADRNLDKVNISLRIKVKPIFGTIEEDFIRDLKIYIKKYVETINENGSNSIYISNLIQSLENDFPDLSYMKFVGINEYDSSEQVIENKTTNLDLLTKEDRIDYVPEYLTISTDDIFIEII